MSYSNEVGLPDMTAKGLAERALLLDPTLDSSVLNIMDSLSLIYLVSDLEKASGQKAPPPEPLDKILIVTAEKDGEGKRLPHRSGSPSTHWFNRSHRTGKRH